MDTMSIVHYDVKAYISNKFGQVHPGNRFLLLPNDQLLPLQH